MVENPQNDENVESMDGDSNAPQNGGLKRRFMRQPIPKKIKVHQAKKNSTTILKLIFTNFAFLFYCSFKRLRRNRRLRKILTPKNALMSLRN